MYNTQHAKVSLPLTQIVRMAKRAFMERSSATPKFCYLPIGMKLDFEEAWREEVRTMAQFVGVDTNSLSLVAYDGMTILNSNGHEIIVTEAPL